MTDVLLATRLKVADPTALTARATLRDRLGLAGVLAGLSREELFLFDVALEPEPAAALVDDLCRRTNLFLNPNKHTYRLATWSDATSPPESAATVPPVEPTAWLLVSMPGEGRDRLDAVHRHVGAPAVRRIARATLWRADGVDGARPAAVVEALRSAAVVESRGAGFLVHPAFQVGHLYAARPSVYDVREALLGAAAAASGD